MIESRLNQGELPRHLFEPANLGGIRPEDVTELLVGLGFTLALEEQGSFRSAPG